MMGGVPRGRRFFIIGGLQKGSGLEEAGFSFTEWSKMENR
jgi:hypothetical protein